MSVIEQRSQRRGGHDWIERGYVGWYYTSEASAKSAILSAAPSTLSGFDRMDDSIEVEELDQNMWEGRVRWGVDGTLDVDPNRFTFDVTGESLTITTSIATIATFAAPGETAPDFKGAINVEGDQVRGVTLPPAGDFAFTETHYKTIAEVDDTYLNNLADLRWKTNPATFRRYAAGEVLFIGASGTRSGDALWEINYRFAVALSKTGVTVGPITGISRKGWEYLWVYHELREDATAKRVPPQPIAAYVEQVFENGDYSVLAI